MLGKTPKTMVDKIWDSHVVRASAGEATILYIDLHLVHEVTSPQAFEGLRLAGREVRRPDRTFATMDHNIPTTDQSLPIADAIAAKQMETLAANCEQFGVTLYDLHSPEQGIVHVIGPEQGLTQPGATIVCGDSHTATHGAFGALAFGIGTSEVEHVLATQCLQQDRPRTMQIHVEGTLPTGVGAKDLVLAIIGQIGTAGGTGYAVEYTGEGIVALSMDERMTVCNMTIEAGARAGLIAPDEKTYEYLKGRPFAPSDEEWDERLRMWRSLPTDRGAEYDRVVTIRADELAPQVTWGTSPGQVTSITGSTPDPAALEDMNERKAAERALEYMGLDASAPIAGVSIDRVFIGSCTNSRLGDLRAAADIVRGHTVHDSVKNAMVVPGSRRVRDAAEEEGLHEVFRAAGFEWREAGCSMCLAMNPDKLEPGERCASTSNRNFEGRQGKDGRTHLVGPEMAAAAAIAGHFVDVRNWG